MQVNGDRLPDWQSKALQLARYTQTLPPVSAVSRFLLEQGGLTHLRREEREGSVISKMISMNDPKRSSGCRTDPRGILVGRGIHGESKMHRSH
jgi:hypothetical protein